MTEGLLKGGLRMPVKIDDEGKVRLSVPVFLSIVGMVGAGCAWLISLSYQAGAQDNRLTMVEESVRQAATERQEIRKGIGDLREIMVEVRTLVSKRTKPK